MGGSGVRVVERTPRVVANRNCCFVGLDVAGSASLRRKTAVEATMIQISDFYTVCVVKQDFSSSVRRTTIRLQPKERNERRHDDEA